MSVLKEQEEWHQFFGQVFSRVKDLFDASLPSPVADESELPPSTATLWRSIHALPCAIKVLNLKVDLARYNFIENRSCQIIRFDFSKLGDNSVEYIGEVDVDDTNALEGTLVSQLGVKRQTALATAEEISSEFRTRGFWDDKKPEFYYEITRYDVRGDLDRLVRDILSLFRTPFLPEWVFDKFRVGKMDFNTLYNLQSDHVISIAESIEAAKRRVYPKASYEDLQRDVAGIQLIPPVPEDVRRVFTCAKNLHIFGYFRYSFFTISQHYALLALESAIKHRYTQSLEGKTILTNKKGETHEMLNPTYQGIQDFCYRGAGWDHHSLVVNNEQFPRSMEMLLDWLVEHDLISKWERPIYSAGVRIRNSLSHLEKASILTPSSMILQRVANQINKLFHERDQMVS